MDDTWIIHGQMEMYPLVLKPVASLKITIKPIGKSSCLSSICMGHFPLCEKSPEALLIIGFTTASGVLVMMVMIELLGLNGYDHGCKYGRRLGIWGTPKDGIWGMSTQGSFFSPPVYRWLLRLIAYEFTFFGVPRFFAEFMNRGVTLNHSDLAGRHRK